MHFKIAQSLLVVGLAVSVCGMGMDAAVGVGSRGEYLRGSCQVISALSAFFLFRHLRDQQKRREPKNDPTALESCSAADAIRAFPRASIESFAVWVSRVSMPLVCRA